MVELISKIKLDKEGKTFEDLEAEIINTSKCCACGACVAYCESQSFDVIKMEGYTPQFKSSKNAENCRECGLCYYICPQTVTLINELNETHFIKDELGNIMNIIAVKTTDEGIRKVGQDGGIITTLLKYLFDKHKIDAVVVSEYDIELKPIPKLIFDKKKLLKSAGTRYSISSNILPLKDLYNIPLEVIEKNGIYDIEQLRVAFIGTPCQCRAINKMKFLNVKPAHIIKYVISLFCFENFDYTKLFEIIKNNTKLKPSNIKKTWIKKNFFILSKDNKKFEVNINKFNNAVRNHCHECDEFTGKFSDLSIGASGAPKEHSIVIIRTINGQDIINSLLFMGLIEQFIVPAEQSSEWRTKKINLFKKMISLKTKK